MAYHSFPNVLIRCVFGTKGRRMLIPEELQPKLWRYFNGIGENIRVPVLTAGGIASHAHLLIALPPDVTLAAAIQRLKANSSRWMGEHEIAFAWQVGYGAFSVSPSSQKAVREYIEHQPEHHARRSFEEEFVVLLRKSGVAYDPERVFE